MHLATPTVRTQPASFLRSAAAGAALLCGAATSQNHVVGWQNPTTTAHTAWVEIAVPYSPNNANFVQVNTGSTQLRGVKIADSGVAATHYMVLSTMSALQLVVGTMAPDPGGAASTFVLHPDVDLSQVFPSTVSVVNAGIATDLPRVNIQGQPFVVLESNEVRLVLKARYSDGSLHGDAYAYVTSLHPAVRFQTEIHYCDIDAGGDWVSAEEVVFEWPALPKPLEVSSDLALANGYVCAGTKLTWDPPCTPLALSPGCEDATTARLGFGERAVFDGMLLFGDDPSQASQRDGARGGPIVGLALGTAWDGHWGALGGIPRMPTNPDPQYTFHNLGNLYGNRPHAMSFHPHQGGTQGGFGQNGLGYVVRRQVPSDLRMARLIVEDSALRPIFVRHADGSFVTKAASYPATNTASELPHDSSARFGRPTPWPAPPHVSGRKGADAQHVRHRDLGAYLQLTRDYQMRDVYRQTQEIDLMDRKIVGNWVGTARAEGRRLLNYAQGWRVFSDPSEDLAFGDQMRAQFLVFEGGWVGGTALAANPNARELVVDTLATVNGNPAWTPWELARAAAGLYACSQALTAMGDTVNGSLMQQRAYECARTACMALYQVGSDWKVPYRVEYAGGVTQMPAGWIAPGSIHIKEGSSDWITWSTSALDVFRTLYPVAQTHPLDAALKTKVDTVWTWFWANRQPTNWSRAHWAAEIK